MGLNCLRHTPAEVYSPYFAPHHTADLKQRWPSIRLFKLKKIFEAHSILSPNNEKYLTYQAFIALFPQFTNKFHSYTENHRRRFFDLFDTSSDTRFTWSNFFYALTLCYFGPQETLATLLFAFYDQDLRLRLFHQQIEDIFSHNSWILTEEAEEKLGMDIEDWVSLVGKDGLGIDEWVKQSVEWIDYQKMRRLFSVFAQEELERELGQNFQEINEVFVASKGRSIGYMVNWKWFQAWCTYMHKEYGFQINGFSNHLTYTRTLKTFKTLKTLKTKKTIRSLKSGKTINSVLSHRRLPDPPRLKHLPLPPSVSTPYSHFNLIHNNIGDKPPEIYNNMLQGQFSEMLAPGLLENLDYVIVSEEVWRRIKLIYGAYPQFRRSGEKSIEIYPKIFKIYTRVRRGVIDYDQQKVCQFSCHLNLDNLLAKAIDCSLKRLSELVFFIKTCTRNHWDQLNDLSSRVADLTSEQLVFLVVINPQEISSFTQLNCKPASNPMELHIGDEFLYSQQKEKPPRPAILVGQSKSKMVVHFKITSYIYDICIEREVFADRAILLKRGGETHRKVRMEELSLSPISESRGLGFVNSVLLMLLSNQSIGKFLKLKGVKKQGPSNFIEYLSFIYHMLTNGATVNPTLIADFIRLYFPTFFYFQVDMAESFIESLLVALQEELAQLDTINSFNPISDYLIQTQKRVTCTSCSHTIYQKNPTFTLTLPLAQDELSYFQVIYVPFAYTLNAVEHMRYSFTLPHNSTFQDYRDSFEQESGLKGVAYAILEVYGNNVVKSYLNALPEATLEQLLLREQDTIYAYQLCLKLDSFISDHYTSDSSFKLRSLKEGQYIDFQVPAPKHPTAKKTKIQTSFEAPLREQEQEKPWVFGRIVSTQIESYTHKMGLKVEYRDNQEGEMVEMQMNPQTYNVAPFPTRSFKFAQHYHLRCVQRVYNEVANQMQLCSQPFIMVVASWMRLREVQLLVYQQIREQIAAEWRFRIEQGEGGNKLVKKDKIKRFRDYLSKSKPYQLKFTDQQGRCALCRKIQKTKLLQNQQEFVCEGCESLLDPQEPIFWRIRPYQLRICLDWISSLAFRAHFVTDHPSCISNRSARKSSLQSLQVCIKQRFKGGVGVGELCDKCFDEGRIEWIERISNSPERLVVVLERLDEDDYRRVNRQGVEFEVEEMQFAGQSYQLTGAIALGGRISPLQYIAYIRDKTRWLEYDSDQLKTIKKAFLQRICPLVFFFHKTRLDSISQQK